VAGGGGFTGIDVTNDDEGNVSFFFFRHFFLTAL
jgi:hypothetical protein